jgi:hypothetical protein
MNFVSSVAIILSQSLISTSVAFQFLVVPMRETRLAALGSQSSSGNYLSSLSGGGMPTMMEPPKPLPLPAGESIGGYKHRGLDIMRAMVSCFELNTYTNLSLFLCVRVDVLTGERL